jgi:hypothetical protein
MELLSDRYGWTPDEIRQMSIDDVSAYLAIIGDKNMIAKLNSKKYGY